MSRPDLSAQAEVAGGRLAALELDALHGRLAPTFAVISAASIVEGFADRRLDLLVDQSEVSRSQLGRALLNQTRDQMHSTWQNRHDWFKRAFGLQIAGTSEAARLQSVVDLRNAIVHGAGRLTDYQERDLARSLELEKRLFNDLGVTLKNGELILGQSVVALACEVCRAYVRFLDRISSVMSRTSPGEG